MSEIEAQVVGPWMRISNLTPQGREEFFKLDTEGRIIGLTVDIEGERFVVPLHIDGDAK
jgi:hypothetical protein